MIRQQSFSLIELLVTLAVLVILMSLLQPSFNRVVENAHRVQCSRNIGQGIVALSSYFDDFNNNLPPYIDETYRYSRPWQTYAAFSRGKAMNQAVLKTMGYLDNPDLYYCPSMEPMGEFNGGGSTKRGHSRQEYPDPWPKVPEGDWLVRTSYYFNPHVANGTNFKYRKATDYQHGETIWMDLLTNAKGQMDSAHQEHGSPGWWLGMIDGSVHFSLSELAMLRLSSTENYVSRSWTQFGEIRDSLQFETGQ